MIRALADWIDDDRIYLDDLAAKFAELYWGHSLPYSATSEDPDVLFQNNGSQAAFWQCAGIRW